MLNILTGRFKLSTHVARMFALASIAPASPDRCLKYAEIILECVPKKVRPALEKLMENEFKSPFIESFRKRGIEEGRVEEAANVLLTILAARGMSVLDQVRARISACTDPDQLEGWIIRAATATTLEEVFAA
jgi:hypothetical protein